MRTAWHRYERPRSKVSASSVHEFFIYALCYRKLDDFLEGGKVDKDLAQVRFEHYTSKRKAKLIALNQQLMTFDPNCNFSPFHSYCSITPSPQILSFRTGHAHTLPIKSLFHLCTTLAQRQSHLHHWRRFRTSSYHESRANTPRPSKFLPQRRQDFYGTQ